MKRPCWAGFCWNMAVGALLFASPVGCSSAYHAAASEFRGPLDERLIQRLESAMEDQRETLAGVREMARTLAAWTGDETSQEALHGAYEQTELAAWELRRSIASVGDVHGRLASEEQAEGVADLLLEMTAASNAVDGAVERYEAAFLRGGEGGEGAGASPEALDALKAQLDAAAAALEASLARTGAVLGG